MTNVQENFLFETLEKLIQANSSYRGQKTLQNQAIALLKSQGLPKNKSEGFDYVNMKPFFSNLEKEVSANFTKPAIKENQIVFIDGEYSKELSSSNFRLEKQSECKLFEAYINKVGHEILGKAKNRLVALNYSSDSDGIFIRIEKGAKIEAPVKILNIVTRSSSKNLTNRIYFHIGSDSHIQIQLIHQTASQDLFHNLVMHFQVEKEASVDFTEISAESFVGFNQIFVDVRKSGQFKHQQLNISPELYRSEINCYLREEESSIELYGLNITQNNSQSHFLALVEHLAENTTSYQQIKNLCFDHSKTSFEGKIFVDPIAQKTKAYQLNQNLVLSEKAANFSKPNLQILADDVKASHGTTFAKISEEELFYLQSRGIKADQAKLMLIRSFVSEFFEKVQDKELVSDLEKMINDLLERKLC